MNDKQKAFLEELGALLDKYCIDEMFIKFDTKSNSQIGFSSNGETLHTMGYDNGSFFGISITCKDMKIKEKEI